MKKALTIAGSDSGGGAGIQADLKTFAAFGVYGMSALTALTAQNTVGVQGIHEVPASFVTEQIDSVLGDLGADVVKTGMLSNTAIIEAIAERMAAYRVEKLVVDPVMVSATGAMLLQPSAREALIERLIPMATVVTPNTHEAEALTGREITGVEGMADAARAIHEMGARWVLVKGGHLEQGDESVDVLFDGRERYLLTSPRVRTKNTHGTGCTLASAIAAAIALEYGVVQAVELAKRYLAETLAAGADLQLGKGHGPVLHHAPEALALLSAAEPPAHPR